MSLDANIQQHSPEALAFYERALTVLLHNEVPFLVGGGFAVHAYTGIARMTKDFDVFIMRSDLDRAMDCLSEAGYRSEMAYGHWLAKAWCGPHFLDLIFNSGNGCCPVDARWFEHAVDGEVLGLPLKICPPEESIWQKSFIMERERYDGADIAHMIRVCAPTMDWPRLLERFDSHWRVLLAHLVLFGFIYPAQQTLIPRWVMYELMDRLHQQTRRPPQNDPTCRGTLLSRQQFAADVADGGYEDPRLPPHGRMTRDQVARWWSPAADKVESLGPEEPKSVWTGLPRLNGSGVYGPSDDGGTFGLIIPPPGDDLRRERA